VEGREMQKKDGRVEKDANENGKEGKEAGEENNEVGDSNLVERKKERVKE
jgi:hypothetical protein